MAKWQMVEAPKVKGQESKRTYWSCKLYALDTACAMVRAAGFPVDVMEFYDWTQITADPRCGNTLGAPMFSIKELR